MYYWWHRARHVIPPLWRFMHRVHHARGSHTCNFSDLPVWDALFGTLHNPRRDIEHCGFPEEARVGALLLGRRVREV